MTTKFLKLEDVAQALTLSDFDGVIAYKIDYVKDKDGSDWWKLTRKIIQHDGFTSKWCVY